jgi:hypothetical protein
MTFTLNYYFRSLGRMLVQAVKTDVGSGKTEINLQNMAIRLRQMRDSGDKRICVVAVPTHALGDQQMTRFRPCSTPKTSPQACGVPGRPMQTANLCASTAAPSKTPRKHSPMSRPRYAGRIFRAAQFGSRAARGLEAARSEASTGSSSGEKNCSLEPSPVPAKASAKNARRYSA